MLSMLASQMFHPQEAQEPMERALSGCVPWVSLCPWAPLAAHGFETTQPLPFISAAGVNHCLSTHALFILCRTASTGSLSTKRYLITAPKRLLRRCLSRSTECISCLVIQYAPHSARVMSTCREILHLSRIILYFVSQIRLHVGFPKLL